MARYTGPVCRLCRRAQMKLFLKGDKCLTEKCPVERRPYPPGQHGRRRSKESEYYVMLREKQKARQIYGVLEKQFKNYYEVASRQKGITGENLLRLLETRLDNVVYRLGFAFSRAEARQLVRHGHFEVNGHRVDIPSYQVSVGDTIKARRALGAIKEAAESTTKAEVPAWLEADHEKLTGRVLRTPDRDDIDEPVKETLIVELYSK